MSLFLSFTSRTSPRPSRSTIADLPYRSSLLVLVLVLASLASAQVGTLIDTSKLPACATNCPLLVTAQAGCVPPAAQVSNQGTYQSCFCQSAYLTAFKTSVTDICGNGACSASDLQKIQSWYSGLCSSGAVVTPGGGDKAVASTSAGAASSGRSTATSTSKAAAAAAASTVSSAAQATSSPYRDPDAGQSWISGHYRWLIMVIVLFIAAMIGIFGGLWFKRRSKRKRDAMILNSTATLGAAEAAQALRSRHPDAPSMTQLPGWTTSGAPQGGDVDRITPVPGFATTPEAKAKERAGLAQVRDMGIGGHSSSSVPISVDEGEVSPPKEKRKSRLLRTLR